MNQRQTNAILIFLGFTLIFFTAFPLVTGGYPDGGNLAVVVMIVIFSALIAVIHYLIAEYPPTRVPTQRLLDYFSSVEGRHSLAWALFIMGGIIEVIGVILFLSLIFPDAIKVGNVGYQLGLALISFGFALTVYSANVENSVSASQRHQELLDRIQTLGTNTS
jgi:hypothetical protein